MDENKDIRGGAPRIFDSSRAIPAQRAGITLPEGQSYLARDISRPIDRLELDGVTYPLAFDNGAMRVAEDVYEIQYRRSLNFAEIVKQLAAGKLGAVMAVLYGALLSGVKDTTGEPMTWDEFSEKFRLTSVPGVKELLLKNLQRALPKAEGKETENPPQTGETTEVSPG